MTAIEIARRFAELGETADACRAYALAAKDGGAPPEDRLEAALSILDADDNYRVSYLCLMDLYRQGFRREDIFSLLTEAFYEPNIQDLRNRYRKNRRLLKNYPYLFRRDFPAFDALPLRFYPYDDGQYFPFRVREQTFGALTEPREPVVKHWFFRDLENPVLAEGIFSQYELEYLRDTVRRSEDVGRENHVYLAYDNWEEFCAWLQVLDMEPLLREEKLVFLIGPERDQYPIDFQARFGIDYSRFPPQPPRIREYNRLIWHAQLSSHNGGDFFNEIFDEHPNLVPRSSVLYEEILEDIQLIRQGFQTAESEDAVLSAFSRWTSPALIRELYRMKHPTDKDVFVFLFLGGWFESNASAAAADPSPSARAAPDPAARIVPALFFQPHFHNITPRFRYHDGNAAPYTENDDTLRSSPIFRGFPYLKTFLPVRRPTTSCGGAVWYQVRERNRIKIERGENGALLDHTGDPVVQRVINRSFMRDPADPLYRDSVTVRLEDGKLNPKAAFTALAAFLDIPYTESMTYCSQGGVRDPWSGYDNIYAAGFSLTSVYKTYEDLLGPNERIFMEFCMRDAYEYFGYGFQYWDGTPLDEEKLRTLAADFSLLDSWLKKLQYRFWERELSLEGTRELTDGDRALMDRAWEEFYARILRDRAETGHAFLETPRFLTADGRLLQFIPRLELDPALLENPLYH